VRAAAASAQAEHGIWIWHTGLLTWAAATCAGLFLCALLQNPDFFCAICQPSLCSAICRLIPYLAVCTQAWQQQQQQPQQQYNTYASPQQPQQQQMQVQVRAMTELFWWHSSALAFTVLRLALCDEMNKPINPQYLTNNVMERSGPVTSWYSFLPLSVCLYFSVCTMQFHQGGAAMAPAYGGQPQMYTAHQQSPQMHPQQQQQGEPPAQCTQLLSSNV
jgi:hypothetical protein